MERFVRGEVVVVPFPFSDLTATKRRPALVLASLPGHDVILCQITSQAFTDQSAIALTEQDFASGGLQRESYVRPTRLFTADSNLILHQVGTLHRSTLQTVIAALIRLFTAETPTQRT